MGLPITCPCRGWAGNATWLRRAKADRNAHHPACSHPRVLTSHALDRFIQRHRPELDRHRAADELTRMLPTAVYADREHRNNQLIYRTTTGILLVVRPDGAVATVLPMGARWLPKRMIARGRAR